MTEIEKDDLKNISVYADEISRERLRKASELDGRTLSNFLLHYGLKRAREVLESGENN